MSWLLQVKVFFFIILNSIVFSKAKAQNLFANSDFETLNNCIEYHQDCSSEAWFYIKPSATPQFTATQIPTPFSGKDLLITPVENIYEPIFKRQFVYTMFCCPLQKGKKYKLSFYINTGGKSFYGLDFYMRSKEFTSANFNGHSVDASIHISPDDIVNEMKGWNYVETIYTAKGDERFCLIGNLNKQKFDFATYQRMNKQGDVFYFLDDIVFKPLDAEAACSNYNKNIEKLYAQNKRHTELVLVDEVPEIITDSIIVPAVFFETDKDVLKPTFKKLLDSLVTQLNKKTIIDIHIEGHTDNTGSKSRNNILSNQRAAAVKKYLVAKMPQTADKVFAVGKADTIPVAPNNNEIGRAKNRRVNIVFSYKNPQE